MDSNYYNELMLKCKSSEAQIDSVIAEFATVGDCIVDAKKELKELIIYGKSFDEGKLGECRGKLNSAQSLLAEMSAECKKLYELYKQMYEQALIKEREAAKKKEEEMNAFDE